MSTDWTAPVQGARWLAAIWAGLIGALWVMVAGWLRSSDTRGWVFVVILVALNIFLLLISLLGSTSFDTIWPALLINAAVLVLAFLPGTKAAFGADAPTQ